MIPHSLIYSFIHLPNTSYLLDASLGARNTVGKKERKNPRLHEVKRKPTPLPSISFLLSEVLIQLMSSLHLSESSYVCFIYNVQPSYLYLLRGIEKAHLPHLSGNGSPLFGFWYPGNASFTKGVGTTSSSFLLRKALFQMTVFFLKYLVEIARISIWAWSVVFF